MIKRRFIGKKIIIAFIFVFVLLSFVSAAPHGQYPAFSQAEFSVIGNSLSASDDIIYNIGYYSVNGAAWQQFPLQGTPYGNGQPFLLSSGTGSLNLPSTGTHYVIVFSCSLVNNAWDCHGDNGGAKWQLRIITSNSDPPQTQGNHRCGDGTCNSEETCSLCRIDCGACPGQVFDSGSSCGDGICDTTEYCDVCAADCGTCPEINCPCGNGEYCSTDKYSGVPPVCLKTASGDTFFVATSGSNSNSGNSPSNAFATWDKAFGVMGPGDVVYIRGGVYMVPDRDNGYQITKDGGSQRILISNYPGERPVLDFRDATLGSTSGSCLSGWDEDNLYAVRFRSSSHITLHGLTVRNFWQRDGCDLMWSGILIESSTDMVVENCLVHDTGGNAFGVDGSNEVRVINCDSYHNVDYLTTVPLNNPMPGNDGSAFSDWNPGNNNAHNYFIGCRAWNTGDQGFAGASSGYTEYNNCWSFDNGVLEGGGHGFKMGPISSSSGLLNKLYKNCLAVNNRGEGFDTNDGSTAGNLNVFNNFAYLNWKYGFRMLKTSSGTKRIYRNNVAYDNRAGSAGAFGEYTHSQNSWDSGVSLSDSDFQSLDMAQLYRSRKADGSLPSITFGKPVSGSDLISQGVYVG